MWPIHTVEYYSAFKKERNFCHMLQHGWTSKTSYYTQEASHSRTSTVWGHLHEVLGVKVRETEISTGYQGPRGGGLGSSCLTDTEFHFGNIEKVQTKKTVTAPQKRQCTQCHWIMHLKKRVKMVNFLFRICCHHQKRKSKEGNGIWVSDLLKLTKIPRWRYLDVIRRYLET